MIVWVKFLLAGATLFASAGLLWPLSGREWGALGLALWAAGQFADALWRILNPKILAAQEEGRRGQLEIRQMARELHQQMRDLSRDQSGEGKPFIA